MSTPTYNSVLIIDFDRRYEGREHSRFIRRTDIIDFASLQRMPISRIREYEFIVISAFDWPNDVEELPWLIATFEAAGLPEPLIVRRGDQNATTEEVIEALRNPERHRYVPKTVIHDEPQPRSGWIARSLSRLRGARSTSGPSC